MDKITLKPKIITSLIDRGYDESLPELKGWEGWQLESDTDKGKFDSEKGAMTDYPLTLTSPNGDIYKGRGDIIQELLVKYLIMMQNSL